MADPRPPTRPELAQFITDQRTLRAFEKLFDAVPGDTDTAMAAAGAADAKAGQALDALQTIAQSLQGLEQATAPHVPGSFAVDYIDFNAFPPHSSERGRVAWNSDDDTLNIHHSDGVTQQVGLETYVRVLNDTGVTIANGSVVGLNGVSAGLIKGFLYVADGTIGAGYMAGLATQDIPDGEIGRVTTYGFVRELDTSAYTVGAPLYASPTVPGALTAIKPTAPALSIPVGEVTVVDPLEGQIFVRPIIEQTKRYAKFIKTADQTPAATNTAYAITLSSASISNGFSLGTPASRIVAAYSGLYTVSASFQLVSSSASVKNVWLWFRKNGTDIANSALKVSLESATATNTQFRSIIVSLEVNDYVELMWAADSTAVTLDNIAATGFAPAAPAVVVTVDQIQQ